jgi:hypothetical protein
MSLVKAQALHESHHWCLTARQITALERLGANWPGAHGFRCVGATPLAWQNAVRSSFGVTFRPLIYRKMSNHTGTALDALNLAVRKIKDIRCSYTPHVAGELSRT